MRTPHRSESTVSGHPGRTEEVAKGSDLQPSQVPLVAGQAGCNTWCCSLSASPLVASQSLEATATDLGTRVRSV